VLLLDALEEKFVHLLMVEKKWQQVARRFVKKWPFPHTPGAVDGKHCRIKKPPSSG